MSTTVPPNGSNITTQDMTVDVYSRMLKSNMESAIEEIILIDERPAEEYVCTCGKCDITKSSAPAARDDDASIDMGRIAAVPVYYVEMRTNADPVVLDEHGVAFAIDEIVPRKKDVTPAANPDVTEETQSRPNLDQVISSFNSSDDDDFSPGSFDPFDPGIDEDEELLLD